MKSLHESHLIEEALRAFGFSDIESRVYVVLTEFPESTVVVLSRKLSVSRSTLYDVLSSLESKGYIYRRKTGKSTVFIAASPETLKREFEARSATFHDALNFIEYSYGTSIKKPSTSLLEGREGFLQLWRRIFDAGVSEYVMITSGITFLDFIKESDLISDIIQERIERNIRSKQLIPDSRQAREIIKKDSSELRTSRLLPEGTPIPTTIIIFGNEVAFMTTRRENTVILVMSGETALTFRMLFDLLWGAALEV